MLVGYSGIPQGLTGMPLFKALQEDGDKFFKEFKENPQLQKEIEYFKKNIGDVKNAEDLVKDYRLVSFVLKSHGMESELNYLGRVKKIMSEDPDEEGSLANRMIDPRFKKLAKTFNFAVVGDLKTNLKIVQNEVVNNYVNEEFEKAIGQNDIAVREARYFMRNSGSVENAYSLLGDRVMRSVVTSTFNIPQQIAVQSVETQARLFEKHVDVDKLKTEKEEETSELLATSPEDIRANDRSKIDSVTNTYSAAKGTMDEIISDIEQLQLDYDTYDYNTSPTGPYAAEVPIQEAAVPTLLEQESLLRAATTNLSGLSKQMNTMSNLLDESQDPDVEAERLTEIQSEFAELATALRTTLEGSGSTDLVDVNIDGAHVSLLDGSLAAPLTATVNSEGQTATVNGYNLTDAGPGASTFLTNIDAANAAVQSGNYSTAFSLMSDAESDFDTVNSAVNNERSYLDAAMQSVTEWVGALDTAELMDGRSDVKGANHSAAKIIANVDQIRNKASEGQLDSLTQEERDDLANEINDLVGEINGWITGKELLDGSVATHNSYEVIDAGAALEVDGYDFSNLVSTYLTIGGTPSKTDFQQLMDDIDDFVTEDMDDAFQELKVQNATFEMAVETMDPFGKVNATYEALQDKIDGLVNYEIGAGDERHAVFDTEAEDERFTVKSNGHVIEMSALAGMTPSYTGGSSLLTTISNGFSLLPGDQTGALAALDQALFDAKHMSSDLSSQLSTLRVEKSLVEEPPEPEANDDGDGITLRDIPNENKYALDLIETFLAKNSAANISFMNASNAYVLNLFQPMGGGYGDGGGSGGFFNFTA